MNKLCYLLCIALACTSCRKFEPNTTYKADGFTLILKDTALVKAGSNAFIRVALVKAISTDKTLKVVFATNKGDIDVKEVPFDGDTALTYLKLEETPEEYYITAQVKDGDELISTKSVIYYSVAPLSDASVSTLEDTTGARADGQSLIKLVWTKIPATTQALKVVFSATKGSLKYTEVNLLNNEAVTYLQLDRTPGVCYIKATLKDGDKVLAEKQMTYSFLPALPESIAIAGDRVFYNLSDPVVIKTVLFGRRGTTDVSKDLKVDYAALQMNGSAGVPVGSFSNALNVRTNDNGEVPDVTFQPNTSLDSTKTLFLIASTQGGTQSRVSDTLALQYRR